MATRRRRSLGRSGEPSGRASGAPRASGRSFSASWRTTTPSEATTPLATSRPSRTPCTGRIRRGWR
eukprot:3776350-Alexandrium_andersonii.AAC.1